jgi:hypothetical protein
MKLVGFTLACLLLLAPCLLLVSSAQPTLSLEWQKNSGFDLRSGMNGQWTIKPILADNTTSYVEFYLDDNLQFNSTTEPFSWTFNTADYPEGTHTIKVATHNASGETATVKDARSFVGFPFISIIGVVLLGSIIFAFVLLLSWYIIKEKARTRQTASKISSEHQPTYTALTSLL